MLVRHEAAISLRKHDELEGWEALRMVLSPSPEALRASMTVAEEKGPTTLATQLSKRSYDRKP